MDIWEGLDFYDFHYPPPVDEKNDQVLLWGIEQMQNGSDLDLSFLSTDFTFGTTDLWELFPIPLATGNTPQLAHREIESHSTAPNSPPGQDAHINNETVDTGIAVQDGNKVSETIDSTTAASGGQPSSGARPTFDDTADDVRRTLEHPPNSPASSYLSSPPNSPLIPPTPLSLSPPPIPPSPGHKRTGGKSTHIVKDLYSQYSSRMSYNIEHGNPLHQLMPEEEEIDLAEERQIQKRHLADKARLVKPAEKTEDARREFTEREVIEIDSDADTAVVPEIKHVKKSATKPSRISPPHASPVKRKAVKQPKRKFEESDQDDDEDFVESEESEEDDGDDLYAPSEKARRQEMQREARRKPLPKKRKVVAAPIVAAPILTGQSKTLIRSDYGKVAKGKANVISKKGYGRRRKEKKLSLLEKVLKTERKAIRKHRRETTKKVQRTVFEKAIRSAIRNRRRGVPEEELPILPSVDEEDLYMDTTDWDSGSESEDSIGDPNMPQVDFIYCHYPQFGQGRRAWIPSLGKVTSLVLKQLPEPTSLFLSFCLKNGVFDICPETEATYEKERERRFRVLELLEKKGFVPNLRTFEVYHPLNPKLTRSEATTNEKESEVHY